MKRSEEGLSLDSWSALYQAQLSRYETVFGADHNMDAKSGAILAATLAVAVFVLNKELFLASNGVLLSMLVGGCLLYIVAIGATISVLAPRLYEQPAVATADHDEYLVKKDDELLYQLIVDTELATEKIIINLERKAKVFAIGVRGFMAGTLLLLAVKLISG